MNSLVVMYQDFPETWRIRDYYYLWSGEYKICSETHFYHCM